MDSGHLGSPPGSGHLGDVTRVFHAELCPSLQYCPYHSDSITASVYSSMSPGPDSLPDCPGPPDIPRFLLLGVFGGGVLVDVPGTHIPEPAPPDPQLTDPHTP